MRALDDELVEIEHLHTGRMPGGATVAIGVSGGACCADLGHN
jgi:hypothetical protein